jgi:O-methyltransferase
LRKAIQYLKHKQKAKKLASIYEKYREFTMIQKDDFVACLKLVSEFNNIPGAIVECGVWRGGMIAGMAEIMGVERDYYLFDSFEGLPPAKEIDGKGAIAWQKDINSPGYYNNCKAEMEWAERAMKMANVPNPILIKGWFEKTVPGYSFNKPIAVLHLDGDWYDSTMICLENLFSKVVKGGLIILDDYYVWEGCSKAVHDYLSSNKRSERIERAYSSGCYLIKHE